MLYPHRSALWLFAVSASTFAQGDPVAAARAVIQELGLERSVLASPALERASGGLAEPRVTLRFVERKVWPFAGQVALLETLDKAPALAVYDARLRRDEPLDAWTLGPRHEGAESATRALAQLTAAMDGVATLQIEEIHVERGRLRWHWSAESEGALHQAAERLAATPGLVALALGDPLRSGGRVHGRSNILRLAGSPAAPRSPEEYLSRIATASGLGASLSFRPAPDPRSTPHIGRVWVRSPQALDYGSWERWMGSLPSVDGAPAPDLKGLGRSGQNGIPWGQLHRDVWVELNWPETAPPAARNAGDARAIQLLTRLRTHLQTADPRQEHLKIFEVSAEAGRLQFDLESSDRSSLDQLCGVFAADRDLSGLTLLSVLEATTGQRLRLAFGWR